MLWNNYDEQFYYLFVVSACNAFAVNSNPISPAMDTVLSWKNWSSLKATHRTWHTNTHTQTHTHKLTHTWTRTFPRLGVQEIPSLLHVGGTHTHTYTHTHTNSHTDIHTSLSVSRAGSDAALFCFLPCDGITLHLFTFFPGPEPSVCQPARNDLLHWAWLLRLSGCLTWNNL